ncbi:hypothetical protein V8D89_010520 [Ganoderma adspersum]
MRNRAFLERNERGFDGRLLRAQVSSPIFSPPGVLVPPTEVIYALSGFSGLQGRVPSQDRANVVKNTSGRDAANRKAWDAQHEPLFTAPSWTLPARRTPHSHGEGLTREVQDFHRVQNGRDRVALEGAKKANDETQRAASDVMAEKETVVAAQDEPVVAREIEDVEHDAAIAAKRGTPPSLRRRAPLRRGRRKWMAVSRESGLEQLQGSQLIHERDEDCRQDKGGTGTLLKAENDHRESVWNLKEQEKLVTQLAARTTELQ